MITVAEVWHLRPEFCVEARRIMQEMDDLFGPAAHGHAGWCGHAIFLQDVDHPETVLVIYPWKTRGQHQDLMKREKSLLIDFEAAYSSQPREVRYYDNLAVDAGPLDNGP